MSAESSDSECGVQQAPTNASSTCTPSTSGSSTPVYCGTRRKVTKAKSKLSRSRYLLAIQDRNRLRKLTARKIRLAANTVSALTLLRWEEKIDRKYEKKFEGQRIKIERLNKSNELLRASQRILNEGCSVLENCATMLQVKLERDLESVNYATPHDFYFPHS